MTSYKIPVEVKYVKGFDSKVLVKKFKSQADLEKWLDKNENDIEVLGFRNGE